MADHAAMSSNEAREFMDKIKVCVCLYISM